MAEILREKTFCFFIKIMPFKCPTAYPFKRDMEMGYVCWNVSAKILTFQLRSKRAQRRRKPVVKVPLPPGQALA